MKKHKYNSLSTAEICKRHKVDHTGTWCGECVLLWKNKAKKYDKLAKVLKEYEKQNEEI